MRNKIKMLMFCQVCHTEKDKIYAVEDAIRFPKGFRFCEECKDHAIQILFAHQEMVDRFVFN